MEQISNKEKYAAFCKTEKNIPIFLQPWWMDAVCIKGSWEALLYEEKGLIKGVLIYYTLKKYGFRMVLQPMLTQYNGIWLKYTENLSHKDKLSFEKRATSNLIGQLQEKTKFHFYQQNFTPNFTNWLPFYWKSYRQTTRYTYQIKDISNPEKCFENFSYSKQKHIKKSESILRLLEIDDDKFYELLKLQYLHQHKTPFYPLSFFKTLYEACIYNKQGKIIAIGDENETIHSALFIVWDNKTAYNLISTIHPMYKSSGASTLAVFEAIKLMSSKVEIFDFEGSMIENVESSFSQFNTEQVPYYQIYRHRFLISELIFKLLKR